MKKVRLFSTLLFGMLVFVGTAFIFPPDDAITRVLQQLSAYTQTSASEKVYLHLDKPYYFAGDDIWFKAYLVSSVTHQPDSASGVLYVELLNDKGGTVAAEKVKLTHGQGHGDFTLSEGLPSATYQIRAYTRWMRNGNPDYFFAQQISVFNSMDPLPATAAATDGLDVQFFPEGGDLIEGIENTLAFKATDKQGKGVPAQLLLVADRDTLGRYQSQHLGMGSFRFTPKAGITYQAFARTPSGKIVSFSMPKARPQGWAMHIDNTPSALVLTVKSNKDAEEKVYIVAQTRGKVTFQSEGRIINNTLTTQIPTSQLPSGVTQLTLFNANAAPQCERLVFVNHQDHIQLQITADKKTYQPREKVTLSLTARDAQGNPVTSQFSMAVRDGQAFASAEHTILTNLLLTSDLRGNIENPGYYFQQTTPEITQALDNLMLTQGWRRFTWKEVQQASLPEPVYEHESDISLTVQMIDKTTQKPLPSKILLISAPGTKSVFRYGYTNPEGKITLSSLDFYDYRNVIVSIYNSEYLTTARVVTDSTNAAPVFSGFSNALAFSPAAKQAVQHKKVWSVIQRNYTPVSEASSTLVVVNDTLRPVQPVYPKADNVIKLADFTLFPTMEEVIRDIVPWGIVTHKKGKTGFRLLDPVTKLYFKPNPIYLIDNVPVRSMEPVLAIDPASVYSLECVRNGVGRAQFGEIGYGGIFSVFTKAGDYYPSNEQGLFNFSVRGFQHAREYYAPKYENPAQNRRQPDFRNLLYWNPDVATDASGKATVTFYNSDDLTTWQVVTEGISAQGKPAVGKLEYEVKMPPN